MCFLFVDLQVCPDILFAVAASSCLLSWENNYHDIQPLQQLNQCTHVANLSYISKAHVCSFVLKYSRTLYRRESWLRALCASVSVDFPHSMQSLSQPGPQPFCTLDIYNIFFHLNGSFFIDKIFSRSYAQKWLLWVVRLLDQSNNQQVLISCASH